jgi:mannose-1-phosphate guanylyltransferase
VKCVDFSAERELPSAVVGSVAGKPLPRIPVAMVLAAGYGTRLRPLTDELPKPLVPVGDRPLIHHLGTQLRAAGVSRLVVNSHHHAEALAAAVLEAFPLPAQVLHEPEILGTAGGVHNAREALGEGDVLVWNGDILAELDLGELHRIHAEQGALATLAVCEPRSEPGTVGVDGQGLVVRLRGERWGTEARSADFVGIQLLSPEARARLPAVGCLVADLYQPARRAGARVMTAAVVRRWQDVGTPRSYLEANLGWLAREGRASYLGPGARIAQGVTLEHCVVGAGAEIMGQGLLRNVVAWPGARTRAPLADAVATTAGLLMRIE